MRIISGWSFLKKQKTKEDLFYLPLNWQKIYIESLSQAQNYDQRQSQRIWARCGREN